MAYCATSCRLLYIFFAVRGVVPGIPAHVIVSSFVAITGLRLAGMFWAGCAHGLTLFSRLQLPLARNLSVQNNKVVIVMQLLYNLKHNRR